MKKLVTTIKSIIGDLVVIERDFQYDANTDERIKELEAQLNQLGKDYQLLVESLQDLRKRNRDLLKARIDAGYQVNEAKQKTSEVLDAIQSVLTKYKG